MQNVCDLGTAPRLPQKFGDSDSGFAAASPLQLEQLKNLLGSVTPTSGNWTQRDVEGLLLKAPQLRDLLRGLLIELAPACPVTLASVLTPEAVKTPLERLFSALSITCDVHPQSFTDEPAVSLTKGYLLTFTAPTSFEELSGQNGLLERFGFWPATLRETLCVIRQNPKLLQLGNIAVCGSHGRRQPNYFPYLLRSTFTPTLVGRFSSYKLRPQVDLVVAFTKND